MKAWTCGTESLSPPTGNSRSLLNMNPAKKKKKNSTEFVVFDHSVSIDPDIVLDVTNLGIWLTHFRHTFKNFTKSSFTLKIKIINSNDLFFYSWSLPCYRLKVFIAVLNRSLCFCVIKLAGAVILGVGIWVKVDSSSLLGILERVEGAPSQLSHLASVGYVLIGVGAFLLVIGFLGCCGAVRESKCMLLTVSRPSRDQLLPNTAHDSRFLSDRCCQTCKLTRVISQKYRVDGVKIGAESMQRNGPFENVGICTIFNLMSVESISDLCD